MRVISLPVYDRDEVTKKMFLKCLESVEAYTVDELSQESREQVINSWMKLPNQDGSINSPEDVLIGLREDAALFDVAGKLLVVG